MNIVYFLLIQKLLSSLNPSDNPGVSTTFESSDSFGDPNNYGYPKNYWNPDKNRNPDNSGNTWNLLEHKNPTPFVMRAALNHYVDVCSSTFLDIMNKLKHTPETATMEQMGEDVIRIHEWIYEKKHIIDLISNLFSIIKFNDVKSIVGHVHSQNFDFLIIYRTERKENENYEFGVHDENNKYFYTSDDFNIYKSQTMEFICYDDQVDGFLRSVNEDVTVTVYAPLMVIATATANGFDFNKEETQQEQMGDKVYRGANRNEFDLVRFKWLAYYDNLVLNPQRTHKTSNDLKNGLTMVLLLWYGFFTTETTKARIWTHISTYDNDLTKALNLPKYYESPASWMAEIYAICIKVREERGAPEYAGIKALCRTEAQRLNLGIEFSKNLGSVEVKEFKSTIKKNMHDDRQDQLEISSMQVIYKNLRQFALWRTQMSHISIPRAKIEGLTINEILKTFQILTTHPITKEISFSRHKNGRSFFGLGKRKDDLNCLFDGFSLAAAYKQFDDLDPYVDEDGLTFRCWHKNSHKCIAFDHDMDDIPVGKLIHRDEFELLQGDLRDLLTKMIAGGEGNYPTPPSGTQNPELNYPTPPSGTQNPELNYPTPPSGTQNPELIVQDDVSAEIMGKFETWTKRVEKNHGDVMTRVNRIDNDVQSVKDNHGDVMTRVNRIDNDVQSVKDNLNELQLKIRDLTITIAEKFPSTFSGSQFSLSEDGESDRKMAEKYDEVGTQRILFGAKQRLTGIFEENKPPAVNTLNSFGTQRQLNI
eukprot:GHVL01039199.1.p1 GENE.GHVL01039199.1~~GHVL01039199.1.p1  ORF type:complete len:760 (-),score=114.67 GHVL01039199.1:135-2414(-)